MKKKSLIFLLKCDVEKCEIISKSVEEEVCTDVPGESCSEVTDEECEIIEEV